MRERWGNGGGVVGLTRTLTEVRWHPSEEQHSLAGTWSQKHSSRDNEGAAEYYRRVNFLLGPESVRPERERGVTHVPGWKNLSESDAGSTLKRGLVKSDGKAEKRDIRPSQLANPASEDTIRPNPA